MECCWVASVEQFGCCLLQTNAMPCLLAFLSMRYFLRPWPYTTLERGYDLVTGEQAPEKILR